MPNTTVPAAGEAMPEITHLRHQLAEALAELELQRVYSGLSSLREFAHDIGSPGDYLGCTVCSGPYAEKWRAVVRLRGTREQRYRFAIAETRAEAEAISKATLSSARA